MIVFGKATVFVAYDLVVAVAVYIDGDGVIGAVRQVEWFTGKGVVITFSHIKLAAVQYDAAYTPEQFDNAIQVDIDDRAMMTTACTGVVGRHAVRPTQGHVRFTCLEVHVTVGSLNGNEDGLTVSVAADDKVAEGVTESAFRWFPPWPLAGGFAGEWSDAFETVFGTNEGTFVVDVIDEPDFANAVTQEDGSRERTLERVKSMCPQFVVKREGHVKSIRWMWCMVEINWIVEQAQVVTAAT